MNQTKRKTCIGWMLVAIASCGTVGALLAMIVLEHPQMGWIIPALGAGLWVFLALLFGVWKMQMEVPESDIHPLIYFIAVVFAVIMGMVIFYGAVHQAFAH
jgi:NAD/NADP transhydrogenase beta subunit